MKRKLSLRLCQQNQGCKDGPLILHKFIRRFPFLEFFQHCSVQPAGKGHLWQIVLLKMYTLELLKVFHKNVFYIQICLKHRMLNSVFKDSQVVWDYSRLWEETLKLKVCKLIENLFSLKKTRFFEKSFKRYKAKN